MHRVPGRYCQRRHSLTAASAAAFLVLSTAGISLWSSVAPASAEPAAASTASPSASPTGAASPTATPGAPPRASFAAAANGTPDLAKGTAYLVAPKQLTDGHYYQPFGGGFADYGLTIDGAFSLASTGGNDAALAKIVGFLDQPGKDGSGRTIDDWTLIGTQYAGGGAIGKEALLAEVVGDDPHDFGGHNLIAALDKAVCSQAGTGCPAPGAYTNSPSVFAQALGVMAQSRAGDSANAAGPIGYLESLQSPAGAWPSLIPSTGDSEVDSTAMAMMALALVPGDTASKAVDKGAAWIAGQQEADGGFPGAAGDSTNSTALAIQGLSLRGTTYSAQITKALAFLAGQQNSDGGFGVAAGGQAGSDLRASAQVVGGATGISFGTLSRDLSGVPTPSASPTGTTSATPTPTPTVSTVPDSPSASDSADAPLLPGTGGAGTGAGGQLAATGSDAREEALLAGALLLAGGAAFTVVRRRTPADGRHR